MACPSTRGGSAALAVSSSIVQKMRAWLTGLHDTFPAAMKLEEVVSKVLRVPVTAITDEGSQSTLGSWTSFRHIQLITALEKAYGVRFETPEVVAATSVAELRRVLLAKGCNV
jgi:acyl carrier protein